MLRIVVLAAAVYLALLCYIKLSEDREVFPGAFKPRPDRMPDWPVGLIRFDLICADGVRLAGYETRGAGGAAARGRWCIFFTGRWGRTRWDFPKLALVRELGFEVLAFDYRGMGGSAGVPSEDGLYRDADAAYDYLVKGKRVPPSEIVLMAHSLGTGVAIDLASRKPVGGLIVDGTYDSVPAIAQAQYPFLPVSWLAHNRFDSLGKIARVGAPKLFFHGEFDETTPLRHARRVFEAAGGPKTFVLLEGRHTDFQWSDSDRYRRAVREFVSGLP